MSSRRAKQHKEDTFFAVLDRKNAKMNNDGGRFNKFLNETTHRPRKFRKRAYYRENDWKKYHSDHGLQAEIASCLHRYMGVYEIAEYLDMDARLVGNVIRDTPELKKISAKNRRDFSRVTIFDRKTGKYVTVPSMYTAAHRIGINTASIKFYANDRHCKYWINNRYKIKRKVWFDEDNGM